MVVDKAFDYLDAPIARLGAPHTPMPYNDRLELEVIPPRSVSWRRSAGCCSAAAPHRVRVRRPVSSCPDSFRASTRPPTLARSSRVMPGPARTCPDSFRVSGYPAISIGRAQRRAVDARNESGHDGVREWPGREASHPETKTGFRETIILKRDSPGLSGISGIPRGRRALVSFVVAPWLSLPHIMARSLPMRRAPCTAPWSGESDEGRSCSSPRCAEPPISNVPRRRLIRIATNSTRPPSLDISAAYILAPFSERGAFVCSKNRSPMPSAR